MSIDVSAIAQIWSNPVFAFIDSLNEIAELVKNDNIGQSSMSSHYQPLVVIYQPYVKWEWKLLTTSLTG